MVRGIQVVGCEALHEAIHFLQKNIIPPQTDTHKEKNAIPPPKLNFSDVKGQQMLIEYLTVAAVLAVTIS
ncbi:hypothetical protein KHA80_11555 [Anaerobacillus sp. HL2]|nr:hypothetical protein KHA80_11555 [Anaerobacillus sp. HL2]